MGSCRNPKRHVDKALVSAILSTSAQLLPEARPFAFIGSLGNNSGAEYKFPLKQDSDYFFLHKVYGKVEYISVDGINISKAKMGSHCVAPNDCWQLILHSPLKDGAVSVFAKELDENQPLLHILLFNTDIGEVDVVGSLSKNRSSGSFRLIAESGVPKSPVGFFMGHVSTKLGYWK
ncbi:hypothetical protein SprV_0802472200 [Sparganum proliferum]